MAPRPPRSLDPSVATVASLFVAQARVVGARLDVTADVPLVDRLVASAVADRRDLSLVVAEVVVALGSPRRTVLSIEVPTATSGPAAGSAEHAQTLADRTGLAMRHVSNGTVARICPAQDLDELVRVVKGAGIDVDRLELGSAARERVRGRGRRIVGAHVAHELLETETVTAEEIRSCVGVVLGHLGGEAGDMRAERAPTAEPAGVGTGGTGWTVAAMAAPIDFTRPLASNDREFTLTLAAFCFSFVALLTAIVVF